MDEIYIPFETFISPSVYSSFTRPDLTTLLTMERSPCMDGIPDDFYCLVDKIAASLKEQHQDKDFEPVSEEEFLRLLTLEEEEDG